MFSGIRRRIFQDLDHPEQELTNFLEIKPSPTSGGGFFFCSIDFLAQLGQKHGMIGFLKQAGRIIYRAGDNLVENDGIEFAGYLSFLSLLALFPFLVLIVAIAGFVGESELGVSFISLMLSYLPADAVQSIKPRIDEIISGPPQGLLTVSILGAIWTSSSMVEGIRAVLNRAYKVSNPPTYLWRRAMSIVQLILISFVIIFVMFTLVVVPLMIQKIELWWGHEIDSQLAAFWADWLLYAGMLLLFATVASLYYMLPNIKQNRLAVIPGAALVVVLWTAGASGFTLYITNVEQVNIIYGSLGGFIATMLFFFIMNLIFIYGAEFNYQLASAIGARVEEKQHVLAEDEVHSVEFGHHGAKPPHQDES